VGTDEVFPPAWCVVEGGGGSVGGGRETGVEQDNIVFCGGKRPPSFIGDIEGREGSGGEVGEGKGSAMAVDVV